MNDSLFKEDHTTVDVNKNYLEELVGEDKKFKTAEDLAKGKYLADQFIAFKNQEYDQLRTDYLKLKEEYDAGPSLRELVDQMKSQQLASRENTNSNEDVKLPAFDPKEVETLVSKQLKEHETANKQRENFNLVMGKLKERYGSHYRDTLNKQVEDLNLDEEYVNELARNRPTVFMRTFGLDTPVRKDTYQAPPRSDVRSDSFSPQVPQNRTWSYYQELRRKNPDLYSNPKTQVQMHKDALELGDAFGDGNWSQLGN